MRDLDRAAALLSTARSLLVLTGAGISAESGIPTYRGPGGIYEDDPEIESKLTVERLRTDPMEVWEHIDAVRGLVSRARPNRAHEILAEWERDGRFSRFLIATQNVDGFHQDAGSDRVTELHGSLWELSLPRDREYAEDESFSGDMGSFLGGAGREALLRKWSRENDREIREFREVPFSRIPPIEVPGVRPNAVLFGEPYGNRLLWVDDFLRRGVDAVLVVGCSGGVDILGRLLARARAQREGCAVINVNPHEDCVEGDHVFLRLPATEALNELDRSFR